MKKLSVLCLLAALVVLAADFKAGLDAYNRGDFAAALKEWQPIAEAGDPNAQYNIGLLYARGQGVPQDYKQAAQWYEKAAQQGVAAAQYNLGVMYANGQGVPASPQDASKWFLKAADQGVIDAANGLGRMYYEGEGAFRNYAEAEKWYRKAADEGVASAAFNLGVMYDLGQGVKKDYGEALKWYHKAADQGYAAAMANLGILYYNAQGVKRDLVEAYSWFSRAQRFGDPRAGQLLSAAANKLNPRDLKKAQTLAAEWRPSSKAQTQVADARLFKPAVAAPPAEMQQSAPTELAAAQTPVKPATPAQEAARVAGGQQAQPATTAQGAGSAQETARVAPAQAPVQPATPAQEAARAAGGQQAQPATMAQGAGSAQETARVAPAQTPAQSATPAQEAARAAGGQQAQPATPAATTQTPSQPPAPAEQAGRKTAQLPAGQNAPGAPEAAAPAPRESVPVAVKDSREQKPDVWTGVQRIVAVGDVHGDYEQFTGVLASAGLIDGNGNWTGGKTHLVQTGDVLDRGPDSRPVMDLLMKLEKQAAEAGGAVHALLGNHEAMNIYGDLRYVSPGEFASYAHGVNGTGEASYADRAALSEIAKPGPGRPAMPPGNPEGFAEQRAAFAADGVYGRWLRSHNAIIKIDRTLFVHGGLGRKYADWPLERINNEVRQELNDFTRLHGGIATDEEGPLWYRDLASGDEKQLEPLVDELLKHFDVDRIVIGHSYAQAAITPRFGGKVVLIDIGLSRVYDNVGKLGCLEIEGDHAIAIHRGQKLELPKDETGPDMLRYLREAAALDPQPSPLLKRIAELQKK